MPPPDCDQVSEHNTDASVAAVAASPSPRRLVRRCSILERWHGAGRRNKGKLSSAAFSRCCSAEFPPFFSPGTNSTDADRDEDLRVTALDQQCDGGLFLLDRAAQLLHGLDRLAVDAENDVARLHAGQR